MPDFSNPDLWLSMFTLTFLEIVLGVDNIIFVSIVANQLPQSEQPRARNLGLALALMFRLLLLLAIGWILSLDKPFLHIPFLHEHDTGAPMWLSVKDLILTAGGVFLLYKSTMEIHHKLEGQEEDGSSKGKKASLTSVIVQICIVNIVFSFDSILTAMGMTKEVFVMMVSVIASIGVMMVFSSSISKFINDHPTMQMLALSFLILIGVLLVAEGFHQHVSKGYVYFAIAFSLGVEVLNMRLRKNEVQKNQTVHLHNAYEQAVEEGVIIEEKEKR